jgi:hypothetical protein
MVAFRRGHVKLCKHLVKHVRQFPPDQDCKRYINSLTDGDLPSATTGTAAAGPQATDKDLLKRSLQCMDLIFQAKDRQTQEANRVANSLLKEIESEKSREQNKKLAAQRKREKRKLKKQQQQTETETKEDIEQQQQQAREMEAKKVEAEQRAKQAEAMKVDSANPSEDAKEEAVDKKVLAKNKVSKKSKKKKKNKQPTTLTTKSKATPDKKLEAT